MAIGAVAGSAAATHGGDDKVTICHRTNSTTNPYVQNSVAVSAVDGDTSNDHGQGDHYAEHTGPVWDSSMPNGGNWGDIIPPVAGVHSGLNWTTAGQAIYDNDCNPPAPEAKNLTYQTVCGQITFSNPNAFAVDVQYDANGAPGGSFEESASVPANGSKAIATTLEVFRFYAYGSDGSGTVLEQEGSVQMPTDCGPDLEMVYGDVTFNEGSVVCVDNQVVYTKPTYVVGGNEHVVYDIARGEHTADFGQLVTVNATGVDDDTKYELAGQTKWLHTFDPKPEAPKDCGTPPEEPEGNLSVLSSCESITIGEPTGIKPDDAEVVIRLDGEVVQPGTHTVEPGSYVVELFVNGEKVDSLTVDVEECETPPTDYNFTATPNQGSCEVRVPKVTGTTEFDASIGYQLKGDNTVVWQLTERPAGSYTVTLPEVPEQSSVTYRVVLSPLEDGTGLVYSDWFTFSVPECTILGPPPTAPTPPAHEPPATADTGVGTGSFPWLPLGGGIAALLLLSGAALQRSGREQAT